VNNLHRSLRKHIALCQGQPAATHPPEPCLTEVTGSTGEPEIPAALPNTTVKPHPVKKMMRVAVRVLYSRGRIERVGAYRTWIFNRLIFSLSVVGLSPSRAAALLWTPLTLFKVSTMISLSNRSIVS